MNFINNNDSITNGIAGTTITTTSGTSIGGSYFVQMSYPISLKDIQRFRKEVKDHPHPCMAFFLKCFTQDPSTKATYNQDHIICSNNDVMFDNHGFYQDWSDWVDTTDLSEEDAETADSYSLLEAEGLPHLISSFNKLTLSEIEVLIKYLKQ